MTLAHHVRADPYEKTSQNTKWIIIIIIVLEKKYSSHIKVMKIEQ